MPLTASLPQELPPRRITGPPEERVELDWVSGPTVLFYHHL